MSQEDTKLIARRFEEEHPTPHYATVADDLLAPNVAIHFVFPGTPDPLDRESWKHLVATFRRSFDTMVHTVEDVIAEGDRVVVRWSGHATHTGALMGIPATGKQVTTSGMSIYRIREGRIMESWHTWDALGLLQQLGAIPAPAQPPASSDATSGE